MNPQRILKPLTFGACVAGVCAACGAERAEGLLRFAINANIMTFPGHRHVVIPHLKSQVRGKPNRFAVTGLERYFRWENVGGRPTAAVR